MTLRTARPVWFIAVGCVAAAVHWLTAVGLVEGAHWHPLLANVGGWCVAVIVSFSGHHRLSFHGHGTPLVPAMARFLAVSAAGFAVNEAVYAAVLHWSGLAYQVLLAIVLLVLAVMTWLLQRHWVFRGSSVPP